MQRVFLAVVVCAEILCGGCGRTPRAAIPSNSTTPQSKQQAESVESPRGTTAANLPQHQQLEDALPDVRAMVSRGGGGTSHSHEEQTASATEIRPQLTTTGDAFCLEMPGQSPMPTPTVYRGLLLTGGGFNSREFYAFDAATGAFRWGVHLSDDGPSTAVPYEDGIIFNTESCTIFVLEVETGKLRWAHWLGDPMMSAPAVADGRVFTAYPASRAEEEITFPLKEDLKAEDSEPEPRLSPTYQLACLDVRSGQILWRHWLDGDCISAPVAVGAQVWAATLPGTLYRFQATTGEIVGAWHARATSAPVVSVDTLFFSKRSDLPACAISEAVAAFDLRERSLAYLAADRLAPYLDPAVQAISDATRQADTFESKNGIPGGFGGGFYAVEDDVKSSPDADQEEKPTPEPYAAPKTANMPAPDALGGQQRLAAGNFGLGNVSTIQAYHGSRVVAVGDRNFNCMGDELLCTDAATGQVQWTLKLDGDLERLGGHLAAPPVAADGDLFVALVVGDVIRVDAATGRVKQRYAFGTTLRFPPVVANGRLYVGTQDGKIHCRKVDGI